MSFLKVSTTAPPPTPAAGLVEVFANTSKRLSQIDDTGAIVVLGPAASSAVVQASPADPTGTTDLTGKMMGLAVSIMPVNTGRILVVISGTIANATAIADGANVQLRTGTGSAPANGDALGGTVAGGLVKYVAATTAQKSPFTVSAIISGLTLATARWIDLGLAAVTGGTATVKDLSVSAYEL